MRLASRRECASWVSTSPKTNPPPCRYDHAPELARLLLLGKVEPAGDPVGVHVLDVSHRLLDLLGSDGELLGPPRGGVLRAEAGVAWGRDRGQLRQGRLGLRVEGHQPRRASSSSTTEGSSLVKIGDGFSTGVPTSTGRRSQAGVPE